MYSFKSRVSYSQIDDKGQLSIPSVVNYLQDASLFHSHDVGMSLAKLYELHRAWLLSTWHIIFNRFPIMGEQLQINTWPYAFKSVYGLRNYTIETNDGEVIAYGEGRWFLFDSLEGKPVLAKPADTDCYEYGEKLDMEYKPRKVTYPDALEFIETVNIYPNQLDTNNHVNNGEYVRISCDYLPQGFCAAELRVEYRTAAHVGDKLHVYRADTDEYLYILLTNQDCNPYTIAEFKKGNM